MPGLRVWGRVLGVEKAVLEGVAVLDPDQAGDQAGGAGLVIVARVRPGRRQRNRCGICLRRCRGYDRGAGRRRWRHVDAVTSQVFLEADAPRVSCPAHGVVVAHVPWARHGAGHTRAFDDTVAWMVTMMSKSATGQLMRIAWRTAGSIITRVAAEGIAARDPLEGLRRIGIDEISYKRNHKYLTVVVDHDTRRLVWAGAGREKATLKEFFDALGEDRAALIEQVSADQALWIADMVYFRAPNAVQCADPFHLVQWAGEALDEVRRQTWNTARRAERAPGATRYGSQSKQGRATAARKLKGAKVALQKNQADLTARQRSQLAWIAASHRPLHRAWELKEAFRKIIKVKGVHGGHLLDDWLAWASRSQLKPFVELARRIRRHRATIDNMLETGLSNGLIESTNTKIRLLTRMSFGFKNPEALISLAMLALGGYRPDLPGRN